MGRRGTNYAVYKQIGSREDGIYIAEFDKMRAKYTKGKQITLRKAVGDWDERWGFTTLILTTVKAYKHFVLFRDKHGLKHTYTYQDLYLMQRKGGKTCESA